MEAQVTDDGLVVEVSSKRIARLIQLGIAAERKERRRRERRKAQKAARRRNRARK